MPTDLDVAPLAYLASTRLRIMKVEVTIGLDHSCHPFVPNLGEVQNRCICYRKWAVQILAMGLQGVQQARTQLSQAIANRTGLPKQFTKGPVRTTPLVSSNETRDGFAIGLSDIADGSPWMQIFQINVACCPCRCPMLCHAGEAHVAGIQRPSMFSGDSPPCPGINPLPRRPCGIWGSLLDLDKVVILEPQPGLMFVFSGPTEGIWQNRSCPARYGTLIRFIRLCRFRNR